MYDLAGTEYSALYFSSSLVLTLFLIPRLLEVVFLLSLATQMITLRPGQWLAGCSWAATLSLPSSLLQTGHSRSEVQMFRSRQLS